MSATPSNMLSLGTKAIHFSLLNTLTNKKLSFTESKGKKGTLVMFICNHCPYVLHINEQLTQLAKDYIPKGINFIAISSNDVVNYPQDAPELMTKVAKKLKYPFPYLYDETQEVAKAYKAACTPDFYLFNQNEQLVYRGQLDDSRPKSGIPVTGKDMRKAMNLLLKGNTLPEHEQKPSIGCNIKWK